MWCFVRAQNVFFMSLMKEMSNCDLLGEFVIYGSESASSLALTDSFHSISQRHKEPGEMCWIHLKENEYCGPDKKTGCLSDMNLFTGK